MMLYGFDTETHLIAPGCLAPRLVCGSVACETYATMLNREETLDWFEEHVAKSFVHITGVRLSYDLGVMCAERPRLIKPVFKALLDGRLHSCDIRQALLAIGDGSLSGDYDDDSGIRYSLAKLVEIYFGIDISADKDAANPDAWRLRYAELDGLPWEKWPWAAIRYPLRDAIFPLQIHQLQEDRASASSPSPTPGRNLHDEFRQMRADFAMHLMAMWGLRTDRAKIDVLELEATIEWENTRRELGEGVDSAGKPRPGIFRPDGTKNTTVVKELVTAAYNGSPPTTPTGAPATDRDTLLESGDPVLMKLGSAGKNDKRLSTYVPILRKGQDVPWNPFFNTLVATGRASSDAQQFPTGNRSKGGVRECFCPRPDFGYSSCDYPGLELFTMSQRAIEDTGASLMAEFLIAGKDCHCHAAAQFMSKTYEEVLDNKKKKPYSGFRDCAKIFNFGGAGGMGAGAMAYNAREKDNIRFCLTTGALEVCGSEGKQTVRVRGKDKPVCSRCLAISKKFGYDWRDAWPEQKLLFQMASLATEMGECDVTVPYSKRVRGGCRYTQWLNTPFQGLGGDLAKDALWRTSWECYTGERYDGQGESPLLGSRPVLFVHDEIICEHPLWCIAEGAERVAQIMNETAVDWLPDVGKAVKVDPAISMIMSKQMATVRDENGKLILWTPPS